MSDEDAFIARHFPPRIVFASIEELRHYKSQLILEAQLNRGTPLQERAILLFQQAGGIEMRLAESADEDVNAPSRNDHLISAASCFVLSGDLASARALLTKVELSPDAASFFARLPQLEQNGARNAIALRDAFVHGSLDGVRAAAKHCWGTVPANIIYWPLLRLASKETFTIEAKRSLRKLVIAFPMDLRYHLLYLSSSAASEPGEAIEHALMLTKAFPSVFEAHVAVATVLVRAGQYSRAIPACERALQLSREHPPDANSPYLSMAFANASIALRRTGQTLPAARVLAEAVQRIPNDPELRTLYALALLETGRQEQATIEATNAASQVDREPQPVQRLRSHWPHTVAGMLAIRREDWASAVRLLTAAAQKSRGAARARNLNDLGVALIGMGDRANAEAAFASAVENNAKLDVAVRNLSRVRSENGHVEMAMPERDEMEDDLVRIYNAHMAETRELVAA